jgi:hypothetical protein
MRWWKSRSRGQKVAIAAAVLAIVAGGGVVAAQELAKDEPVKPRSNSPEREQPTAKPTGKPLKLGTVARISSNYRVAVTELTLYKVPTGQLMVVTVKAKYVGKEDGEPWGDLTVKYVEPDSRTYGESACPFDLGELDASDQATLKPGDTTTYGVCLDLPGGTIDGRVSVEEALARQEGTKSWATDEAVTKAAPSMAAPDSSGSSGDRDGETSFRGPSKSSGGADYSKTCEKYEDDMEEYRDGGREKLEDLGERYEDNPDHDDEDLDEYREWLDGMEKNAEWFDQHC